MKSFFLLLLAAAVSMLVIPAARRLAPHIGMVDMPDPRKVHLLPIPRVGGWGLAAGALLPLLLLDPIDPAVRAYLAGGMLLFAFGVWDDARELGHWPKFLGQALAAGIVVFHGDLYVTRLPFAGEVFSPLAGQLFTVVAIVGVINAINHSDGLDGLAGGETLLSLVAICFLGHLIGNELLTDISLAVNGGIIGFLRFNTHPAIVFMGDSGSQFLGFTLAFLVVYLAQVANPASSAALPLLLIGLPIADILAVFYQRMRGGMNWFKATRNHVHHRLLDLGLTHYESVVAIYSLQAVLVTCAVLLRYAADELVLGLYLLVVGALFIFLVLAERGGWRIRRRSPRRIPLLERVQQMLRRDTQARGVQLLLALPAPLFLVGTVLWSSEVPRDFGIGAATVGLILVAMLANGTRVPVVAARAAVYVTIAFATYLFVRYPGVSAPAVFLVANASMFGLATVLALYIFFVARKRFDLTPTDYLIAFAGVALALFVRFGSGSFGAGRLLQFVLYAVVLFYACEVVINNSGRWRYVLGFPAALALGIMAARGLS